MKRKRITNEGHTIQIDTRGAKVSRWKYNRRHIFFPDQTFGINGEMKRRGGCPICAPNFGSLRKAGSAYRLPKHGSLRSMNAIEQIISSDRRILRLTHTPTDGFPFGFECDMGIEMTETGFHHRLMISRTLECYGDQGGKMPLNIGIHPYFQLPDWSKDTGTSEISTINHYRRIGSSFGATIWELEDPTVSVKIDSLGEITMKLRGYRYLAVWSDSEKYACAEPIMSDPEDFGSPDGKYLDEGGSLELSCEFSFDPV